MRRFAFGLALGVSGTLLALAALWFSVAVVCPRMDSWIAPPGTPRDFVPVASVLRGLTCHGLSLLIPFVVLGSLIGRSGPRRIGAFLAAANPLTMWVAFTLLYLAGPSASYVYMASTTWIAFGLVGTVIGMGAMMIGAWAQARFRGLA